MITVISLPAVKDYPKTKCTYCAVGEHDSTKRLTLKKPATTWLVC